MMPPQMRSLPVGPYMTAIPLEITDHGEWEIRGRKGDFLGYVDYYKPWRQHVFSPAPNIVMSHDCLSALALFIRTVSKGPPSTADQQALF